MLSKEFKEIDIVLDDMKDTINNIYQEDELSKKEMVVIYIWCAVVILGLIGFAYVAVGGK